MFANIITKTAAEWTAENQILALNEIGREIDYDGTEQIGSGRTKFGDGITPWPDLPYTDRQDIPMDLVRQIDGLPGASATILRYKAARATRLEATGHQGYCAAATVAAADADFEIEINGVSVGTLRFEEAEEEMVIVDCTETDMAVGDKLEIIAPLQDVALADLTITLKMTLI